MAGVPVAGLALRPHSMAGRPLAAALGAPDIRAAPKQRDRIAAGRTHVDSGAHSMVQPSGLVVPFDPREHMFPWWRMSMRLCHMIEQVVGELLWVATRQDQFAAGAPQREVGHACQCLATCSNDVLPRDRAARGAQKAHRAAVRGAVPPTRSAIPLRRACVEAGPLGQHRRPRR